MQPHVQPAVSMANTSFIATSSVLGGTNANARQLKKKLLTPVVSWRILWQERCMSPLQHCQIIAWYDSQSHLHVALDM